MHYLTYQELQKATNLFRKRPAFLRLEKVLLGMGTNLHHGARSNEVPNGLPVLAVALKPDQKLVVFLQSPATLSPPSPAWGVIFVCFVLLISSARREGNAGGAKSVNRNRMSECMETTAVPRGRPAFDASISIHSVK